MREVQSNGTGEALDRFERRSRIGDVFAVILCERAEGEAIAYWLLFFRMDVLSVAGVDGNGEAGVGNGGRGDGLRFARFSPVVVRQRGRGFAS